MLKTKRQDAENGFNCTGSAEQVSSRGLGGTDCDRDPSPCPGLTQRCCFSYITDGRTRRVSIDVNDILRRCACRGERSRYGSVCAAPFGIWRRDMERIGCHPAPATSA